MDSQETHPGFAPAETLVVAATDPLTGESAAVEAAVGPVEAGQVTVRVTQRTPGDVNREETYLAIRAALGDRPSVERVNVEFHVDVAGPPDGVSAELPGVRHVIAVGSGKGGVGKSTVAVNLAAALAEGGARVGLMDADVYGPSVPIMMGIRRQPQVLEGRMIPLERHGVRLMSLGFLMPEDGQVIWRGPMVAGAVRQMLVECRWGGLDYLLVDLPPGTGDAQLTLAQSVPLTGAVVVMTGQDVAVSIAAKAIGMFRRLKVPILGVVGNMDEFVCPHCGTHTAIFRRGGSEEAASRLGVPFLGSIPLDPQVVEHGDTGVPTVLASPGSEQAAAFRRAAWRLARGIDAYYRETGAAPDPFRVLSERMVGA